tara:strand:- start:79 stop:414 length:336 start_codon:yes stop_codon:yes gene_type:complete
MMRYLSKLSIIIILSSCQTTPQDIDNRIEQADKAISENMNSEAEKVISPIPRKGIRQMGEFESPTSSYLLDRSFKRSGKTICVYKSSSLSSDEYFFALENFSIRCPMFRDQ